MVNYYLERVKKLERQLNNAKVGFQKRIKDLGLSLMNCAEEDTLSVIEDIKAEAEAMIDLQKDYENALKTYREEAVKGGQNNG